MPHGIPDAAEDKTTVTLPGALSSDLHLPSLLTMKALANQLSNSLPLFYEVFLLLLSNTLF